MVIHVGSKFTYIVKIQSFGSCCLWSPPWDSKIDQIIHRTYAVSPGACYESIKTYIFLESRSVLHFLPFHSLSLLYPLAWLLNLLFGRVMLGRVMLGRVMLGRVMLGRGISSPEHTYLLTSPWLSRLMLHLKRYTLSYEHTTLTQIIRSKLLQLIMQVRCCFWSERPQGTD